MDDWIVQSLRIVSRVSESHWSTVFFLRSVKLSSLPSVYVWGETIFILFQVRESRLSKSLASVGVGGGGGHIVISALSPPLLSQRCDRFRCHNTVSVHIGVWPLWGSPVYSFVYAIFAFRTIQFKRFNVSYLALYQNNAHAVPIVYIILHLTAILGRWKHFRNAMLKPSYRHCLVLF